MWAPENIRGAGFRGPNVCAHDETMTEHEAAEVYAAQISAREFSLTIASWWLCTVVVVWTSLSCVGPTSAASK